MDRALVVAALLALVALAVVLLRRRSASSPRVEAVDPDELGLGGGRGLAVVGFSSRYCIPCRQWEAALNEAGVRWSKVDVGARPGVARRYGVVTTPLVLAVELPSGRVVARFDDAPVDGQVERLAELTGGG